MVMAGPAKAAGIHTTINNDSDGGDFDSGVSFVSFDNNGLDFDFHRGDVSLKGNGSVLTL
jgi:hypothetical protein